MMFFKQHRSAERDAFSVPHSVQKSIPIKRIYQDGVFQVSGKFSKTWRFFDVNYAVASPEKHNTGRGIRDRETQEEKEKRT